MTARLAYSVPEAAEAVGVSESTIRRAIAATDPAKYPPPLDAGRHGPAGKYVIAAGDLKSWVQSLKRWAS